MQNVKGTEPSEVQRPAGYRRGDGLSAIETAVWGTGKGHGCRGHLQGGVNEAMRMDELRERQNGREKGEGLKEAHC